MSPQHPLTRSSPFRNERWTTPKGMSNRGASKLDSSGNNKKILRVLANPSAFRPVCAVDHGPALKRALPTTHTGGCHPSLGGRRRTVYEWLEHVPMAIGSGVTKGQSCCDRKGSWRGRSSALR